MSTLRTIFDNLSAYDESMLEHFIASLRRIVTTAESRTIAAAQNGLTMAAGRIARTQANAKLIRQLGRYFETQADAAGLNSLVGAFAETFDGSLVYMDQIVGLIRTATKRPFSELSLSAADIRLGQMLKTNAAASLSDVVTEAAQLVTRKALFSVGGLQFGDLVELMAEQFEKTIGQAETLAATSQSTFYRTIQANQYQRLEAESGAMRYEYAGPRDKLNRPFCKRELDRKQSQTQVQIEKLDNGMLPNPFVSAGGWNCRHQWVLDVAALQQQFGVAA